MIAHSTAGDLAAIAWSALYFAAVWIAASAGHRFLGLGRLFARKAFLVGTGVWIVPAITVFRSWQAAALPPSALALVGYLSYRYRLFGALEDRDRVNLGLACLPLATAVLFAVLFRPGRPDDAGYLAAAGIMASIGGDTAAAFFGRRYGTRRYRLLGHPRTMEGTLAFFLASSACIAPTLVALGGIGWHQAVAFGLIGGTAAALTEIVSFYGSDNLTVPLTTSGTLYFLAWLADVLS